MDELTRRAYLEAMGIPVWLPRGAAPADEPEFAAAEVAQGDATTAATESPVEPSAATAIDRAATDVADMDFDTLRETILGCTACGLCETRKQAVPGVGDTAADLLIIGEAPGQEEDRRGEPFVGPAGQLLDRMLAAIGRDRQTVFITNVLKCRPPNNRDPKVDEVQACSGYLRRQIELIQPRVILSVGRISSQNLLETDRTIGRMREQWHRFGPQDTPLRVTYHPAYLLRSPGQKRKVWDDLKAIRARLAD